MRLTLRTLLAYLDDVLDPADKDELSQKIESSEFAEDLVHRTRDTMRRLRLSAPQVIGTGMGLDPNTVSEYLDNVLPPEQVGDYERICLESDVHLAEAAACHHVLTMVLGEPADVDPRLRQRMYGVPAEARERKRHRVEAAHTPAAVAAVKPPASATAPVSHQPTTPMEIPEYLRAGSWWQSRGALTALAVALLLGTTLYLVSGLTGWFGGEPQASRLTLRDAESTGAAGTPDQPAAAASGDIEQPSAAGPMKPLAPPPQLATPGMTSPAATSAAASTPYTVAEETADRYAIASELPAEPESIAAVAPPEDSATVQGETEVEVDRYGLPVSEPVANIAPGANELANVAALPNELNREADEPAFDDRREMAPPDSVAAEADIAVDTIAAEEAPAGPPELGTYLGGKTVLLRYDEPAGAWFRLEPRAAVVAGQRLVALPEFRPKVTFAAGLHMDISGGTQVLIGTGEDLKADGLPPAGAQIPAVEVVYGRIILINTSMTPGEVRLKLGPNVGDAKLARNATLAIEVERQYVAGNDPRETPSPVVVRFFAPDGGVTWQDGAVERSADAASSWTIAAGETTELTADDSPPEWIDQEPGARSIEQRFGAPVVESTLVSNRPVDIQLLELYQANAARREVKSLVTRSSIHVGLFEPFVEALRDSEQRANWSSHITALRAAMALSPESASRVWQALVAQRGERSATDLYEMLSGYNEEQIGRTPEQRKMGALARLIDWLEEDSLDYRVLAVHDLAEITGKRLMSNPAANSTERAQSVRRWRSRLQSDELRPLGAE